MTSKKARVGLRNNLTCAKLVPNIRDLRKILNYLEMVNIVHRTNMRDNVGIDIRKVSSSMNFLTHVGIVEEINENGMFFYKLSKRYKYFLKKNGNQQIQGLCDQDNKI